MSRCFRYSFSYGVISTYVAIYGKEELGIMSGTGLFFSLFAIGLILSRLTGAHALRHNQVSRNAGFGVLAGGLFPEHLGYHWAFWVAAAVNTLGMAYYFLRVRRHFESNKLR